jgi:endoglucanase
VYPLGTIALAFDPRNPYCARARTAVIEAGRLWVEQSRAGGFPAPLDPSTCPWGSNSFVLNKALVMALAADFSDDVDQRALMRTGVIRSMDYILGCNALDLSQVTGFGERCVRFPHHRFWAGSVDPSYPLAPPGCLVGGPNSETFDQAGETARLSARSPQRCHLDDIRSWATNEVAINWNAPLVWVAGWLCKRLGQ